MAGRHGRKGPARHGLRPIEFTFPNLGLGHVTDLDPRQVKPGNSVRTWDVNLDTIGGVGQRGGIGFMSENGACALGLATFDFTATPSESWDGQGRREKTETGAVVSATSTTVTLPNFADAIFLDQFVGRTFRVDTGVGSGQSRTITDYDEVAEVITVSPAFSVTPGAGATFTILPIIRPFGATGPRAEAIRLASNGAGTPVPGAQHTLSSTLDLSPNLQEFICFWVWCYDKTAISFTAGSAGIRFELHSTLNVNLFRKFIDSAAQVNDVVNDGTDGWTFFAIRKSAFTMVAAGNWAAITHLKIAYTRNVSATVESVVVFANAWVGAEVLTGLYNWIRSPNVGGGNYIVAAGRGCISIYVPEQNFWRQLVSGMQPDRPVIFESVRNFLYAVQEGERPKLIVDSMTAYEAGIVAPAAAPTLTIIPSGGFIESGEHTIAVVFYSTVTGRESDPIFTPAFAVSANNSSITLTNLPVSVDPKVTHLRIYRLAPGQPSYKRISPALDGEVTNGVTTFLDTLAATSLTDELEGDNTYDLNGVPPNAGVVALVSNRMVYNDPAQPGRVWVSREGDGERVPGGGSVPLDEGDNDVVTAARDVGGFCVVWKNNSFYVGPDVGGLQPFSFQRMNNKIGTLSHRSVIVDDNAVRFRHASGYYEMDRGWDAVKISGLWDGRRLNSLAEPVLQDMNLGRSNYITSAYLTERDQIYWTEAIKPSSVPSIQPVLHKPLQEHSGWAFHRAPVSIIANSRDFDSNDERVIGGGDAGIVYFLNTNRHSDHRPQGDVAIDMDYLMPYLEPVEAEAGMGNVVLKRYHYIDMVMRGGGNWPLDYEAFYDWEGGAGDSGSIAPMLGAAIGVTFTIGVSAIGGKAGHVQRGVLSMGRHRTIAIRWRNNRLDEAPYISNFFLWANPVRLAARKI